MESETEEKRVRLSLTFNLQIGLVRESVTVEQDGGELSLNSLKEIACEFVDRKVGNHIVTNWDDIISGRGSTVNTRRLISC